jgi:hypothetical protein
LTITKKRAEYRHVETRRCINGKTCSRIGSSVLIKAHKTPQNIVKRSRIMLMSAEGLSNNRIAQRLSVSRPTLILLRKRFAADGPAALTETVPGRGRPSSITLEKVKEIVEATLHTKPKGVTHWI